jgi:hypothetical protein
MTTVSLTIQNNKIRLIMKELSIEEKAKRYDEAFDRARKLKEDPTSVFYEYSPSEGDTVADYIFPELKESEDEKIKKRIIALVNAYGQGMYKDEMLAWLEKKGETSEVDGTFVNIDDVREYFMQEIYRILDADPTNDRANQIIDAFDNLPTITIKQDPCKHCKMTYSTCYSFPCDEKKAFEQGKTALEAINEEKVDNANKVELKFKVGDWITNGIYTCKIVEVIDNSYKYTFPEGASYLGVIDDMDKEYRLWTIDDAKDGDVLATEDAVFIFKHIDKTGLSLCKSYCEVIGNSELGLGFDFSINGVYPASKEQRELLHSKIKEAGYEWDAEKFELKKIKPEFWSDDAKKILNGFYITSDADIRGVYTLPNISNNYNVFATVKQAKSALAMARISQIMANDVENFGGVITYEEWKKTEKKFAICRSGSYICKMFTIHDYYFLTFHTAKQRDLFLKKYPQLVKDYLMIPYLMIPDEKIK